MSDVVTGTDASGGAGRLTALASQASATEWSQASETQLMDVQSIVEAEAGLARGVGFALLFALPFWMTVAGVAAMLSG